MKRTITSVAFATVICAISMGQVVRFEQHDEATDVWGSQFSVRRQITFSGRITGITKTRPASATDDEVTILVQNKKGGGTATVDLGPAWYVNNQDAKIRLDENVQVTGSKTMVDGHGLVLASQVVIEGRGGPVLALRRISGKAYWLGSDVMQSRVAQNSRASSNNQATDPTPFPSTPNEGMGFLPVNGFANYNPGPGYDGQPNVSYQVGYGANIVSGYNPVYVNPYVTVLPYWSTYTSPTSYNFGTSYPAGWAPYWRW